MKNNSGFSLVELIVVIAIMAILAGVAVPTYSKYVAKANDAKVNAQLDEVKTAALAAAASEGTSITKITVTTTDAGVTTVTVEPALTKALVTDYLDSGFKIDFKGTSYATDKTKSGGTVTWQNENWSK